MDRDDRQNDSSEQVQGSREPQRATRPAPGKVTRTSKLSSGRGGTVQRKAAATTSDSAAPPARSQWELTMDPSMDAAHRGVTALAERGNQAPSADGGTIYREAAGAGTLDGDIAGQVVEEAGQKSAGQALEPAVQRDMERGFGADLSGVRVHTDGAASSAASALNARAFTTGSDKTWQRPRHRGSTPPCWTA